MAITVDWSTQPYLITIPKTDLTLVQAGAESAFYADFNGVAGDYISTPDSATNSVTGDIDIRVKVAMDDWTPSVKYLVSKWGVSAPTQSYIFGVLNAGTLQLVVTSDGDTDLSAISTAATGFTDGTVHWVRATRESSTGNVNFYTSDDGVSWSLLGGADVSTTAGGIYDSGTQIEIGAWNNGAGNRVEGKIYEAYVLDGIDGSLAVDFNASDNPTSAATHQDSLGATWSWTDILSKLDLTTDTGSRYNITVDYLWQILRDFSDNPEGMVQPITYRRIAATASTPAITEINDPVYACQFENGNYSVDIINGNTNFRDVEVKNNVSVGTNNTTGFINPVFLEDGLFNGEVCIDFDNGFVGTNYTSSGAIIGTRSAPAKYVADATVIAQNRNLNQLKFLSSYTLDGATPAVYFADFNGVTNDHVSTPDSATNSITGDIDIRVKVAMDDWTPAANATIAAKRDGVNGEWQLNLITSGILRLTWWEAVGPTVRTADSTVATGIADGNTKWVRVTLDVDNGSSQYDVKFYTSDDGSSWAQLGATVTGSTGVTDIRDQTSAVAIGVNRLAQDPITGNVYEAYVYDGIDGSLAVDFNASDNPTNQTTHVDSLGATWTWTDINSVYESGGGAQDTLDGYKILGDKVDAVTLTINPNSVFQNCEIWSCTVTGTLDNSNILRECIVGNIDYFNGYIEYSSLTGTITMGGGSQLDIVNCWSAVAGGGAGQHPHIDMGGSGNNLTIRGYRGGIGLDNYAGMDAISIDMDSGRVHLSNTITSGDFYIRGVADIEDESTGTAVIYDYTLNGKLRDVYISAYHKRVHDKLTNTITIYDRDGVTPLYVFNADDDLTTITPQFTPDA